MNSTSCNFYLTIKNHILIFKLTTLIREPIKALSPNRAAIPATPLLSVVTLSNSRNSLLTVGRFRRGFRRLHSSFLPVQNMQGNNQPDHRLPPRLFATDRFPSGRLNIYSKPDLLAFIRHTLRDTEELDYTRRSCFGKLFDLPARQCPVSCKLIHTMLTRQLVVEDNHTLWSVFGSDPIKFGLQEFGTITDLPCGAFPVGYTTDKEDQSQAHKDPYWIELIGKKRFTTIADLRRKLETDKHMPGPQKLRLALIIIVDGVLIAHQ
ncbi:hypothetical protein F2Q69_00058341 [Brassica cretica]|uniref:DUF1985 domain-containing protein n=1 Tax=Brassica cretica TaxID=69181 RepID=A0A8S9RL80_BRACR|nr:hypothetical protein F2Q69_00058341 [Brassica cretica]